MFVTNYAFLDAYVRQFKRHIKRYSVYGYPTKLDLSALRAVNIKEHF